MGKLLHERLKEWAEMPCPLNTAFDEYEISEFSYDDEVKKLFTIFADEIERYYIPRPRFDDGEPVQFGDAIKHQFGGVDVDKAIRFQFNEYGTCEIHGMNEYYVRASKDEPLKRTTPKVYDADGVEIKVGDTVYSVSNGKSGVVCDAGDFVTEYSHGEVMLEGCDETYKADLFTHERPVFDADGERIRKGDTVWFASGKNMTSYIVQNIKLYEDDMCVVVNGLHYEPYKLTHHEPDSLEKLRNDMNNACDPRIDADDVHKQMRRYADRLTALIERGA